MQVFGDDAEDKRTGTRPREPRSNLTYREPSQSPSEDPVAPRDVTAARTARGTNYPVRSQATRQTATGLSTLFDTQTPPPVEVHPLLKHVESRRRLHHGTDSFAAGTDPRLIPTTIAYNLAGKSLETHDIPNERLKLSQRPSPVPKPKLGEIWLQTRLDRLQYENWQNSVSLVTPRPSFPQKTKTDNDRRILCWLQTLPSNPLGFHSIFEWSEVHLWTDSAALREEQARYLTLHDLRNTDEFPPGLRGGAKGRSRGQVMDHTKKRQYQLMKILVVRHVEAWTEGRATLFLRSQDVDWWYSKKDSSGDGPGERMSGLWTQEPPGRSRHNIARRRLMVVNKDEGEANSSEEDKGDQDSPDGGRVVSERVKDCGEEHTKDESTGLTSLFQKALLLFDGLADQVAEAQFGGA